MDRPIRLLLDSESEGLVQRVSELPESCQFDLLSYLGQGTQKLNELIANADAVYIYKDELSGEAIRSAPALRFIQKHGLNCKNVDVAAAAERGIPVATMPLFRNVAVAEHAFALMIACAHKLLPGHRSVENAVYHELGLSPIRTSQRGIRGNWAKIQGVIELMGASVGIIGLGDIGMEFARRCRAFGMDVFYHQRTRHLPDVEKAYEAAYLPLHDLLKNVDYVTLILPHTPQTEKMIGAAEFAMMKPTATLINVARGGIVDEPALVDALSRGVIGMAGLDVFHEEPLPDTSPLLRMSNVVLTPHLGGGSYQGREADYRAALTNILQFFRGEKPAGVLNATSGRRAAT
ncbi:MAG: glyoxylate reductase [Alphaproteobacteria bacterium]|nr:glyoxylate reductase [Alphaproteobacteria bacterium]